MMPARTQPQLIASAISSPIGELQLMTDGLAILSLILDADRRRNFAGEQVLMEADHPLLQRASQQLHDYFSGRRQSFDLPLRPAGSIFQLKAWRELSRIPYGTTISYGEQARRMGDSSKARAVGAANGRNPLPVLIPCHRVIGASGALVGFSGGLKTKEFLLNLERQFAR